MLTDHDLELLTGFVDGELQPRQREEALRLLHDSSEARSVLKDFQEAAHRMRQLPRRKLGGDFAGAVVLAIAERGLKPARGAPRTGRWPLWTRYAVAAVLLLAAGVGAYFAWRGSPDQTMAPMASSSSGRFSFKELADEPKRVQLAKQIKKETAVHLALTVRDNAKAVGHLQDVMKSQGIKMIVDDATRARLDATSPGKTEFLIYAENIQTDELAAMLRQLGDDARNPSAPKTTFEFMVVKSLSTGDRENLAGLLGVTASELQTATGKDESNLFEDTIIAAPSDKSRKLLANSPVPLERFAMVMANDAGKAGAADVRRFLASRRPQQPGTVQVLIVIRQA